MHRFVVVCCRQRATTRLRGGFLNYTKHATEVMKIALI